MKPLKHPPAWEGNDTVNTPPGLKKVTSEDELEDTHDLKEDEDAEDDDDDA